jgi:hypothetical protein
MKKRASNEVFLSRSVTVADYRAYRDAKDKDRIADFLFERLHGRYLKPFASSEYKHGFAMMACGCLLVETLEAFWTGSAKSGSGGQAFTDFFTRVDHFVSLRKHARLFYKHVRCGIMHQGETTGGWRVRRDSDVLFTSDTLVIDATRFLNALEKALADYCELLKASEWDSSVWDKCRRKIKHISAGTLVEAENWTGNVDLR